MDDPAQHAEVGPVVDDRLDPLVRKFRRCHLQYELQRVMVDWTKQQATEAGIGFTLLANG
jgi:hypothetical protein